ncbi:putative PTS IIA-like nitrogen-regulatory protein PtsN [Psychromonas sp. CNPT3]|uniref:PTS sugar transporter subunit IIA n=1 Tax=Psychromonas sp. CNPT3 TaxID=314282 RepID=UPI00006E9CDB|nr:PTS sugar transporter subunit IIA [Psychromonas sp. CNPT3]AGH81897.1 putative PTS IIA-like nitrogen-regulatory protein PtsN [Psychromonas sp. CNPT3]
MKISTLITEDSVFSQVNCNSKKSALEKISISAAKTLNLDHQVLFNELIAREKIGSTAVGSGVAIPHIKISSDLPATGVFLQCQKGIDYDASDGKSVDILFAIFVPEDRCQEYLSALATISEKLLDKTLLRQLRSATDDKILFECLQCN